jgi:CheY-like chemotaxis protein
MTILAVDDDDDDLEFFGAIIHAIDPTIRYIRATSCAEAYDILKHTVPDVLFLDINMPKVNGLECFKYLKQTESLKRIPVVFYSTAVNPANIRYLLSHNVKFISKEAHFEQAKASIIEVLKALHVLQGKPA